MPLLKKEVSSVDLQIELKRKNIKQRELKQKFNVTDGAISRAIQNDPALKSLRKRIIQYLNSLQSKRAA